MTEEEKTAIEMDVELTLKSYYIDIREKGLMAEFDYLDDSEDFFWVPPGASAALAYDSVYSAIAQNASRYRLVDNRWTTLLIRPLSDDYAFYHGLIESSITDTAGVVAKSKLIETGLMVKRTSGWKLVNGQTSLIHQGEK